MKCNDSDIRGRERNGGSDLQRAPNPRNHLHPSQEFRHQTQSLSDSNLLYWKSTKLLFGRRCQAPCIRWIVSYFNALSQFLLSGRIATLSLSSCRRGVHPHFTQSRQFCCLQPGIAANPWGDGSVLAGSVSLLLPCCLLLLLLLRSCLCSSSRQSRPWPRLNFSQVVQTNDDENGGQWRRLDAWLVEGWAPSAIFSPVGFNSGLRERIEKLKV